MTSELSPHEPETQGKKNKVFRIHINNANCVDWVNEIEDIISVIDTAYFLSA